MKPFRLKSSLSNDTLLLREDGFYQYVPDGFRDRIRPIPYTHIGRFWVTDKLPWGWIVVVVLFMLLPGMGLMALNYSLNNSDPFLFVLSAILMMLGLAVLVFMLYRRTFTLTFDTWGERRMCKITLTPAKMAKAEAILNQLILNSQTQAWKTRTPDTAPAETQPSAGPPPIPEPPAAAAF